MANENWLVNAERLVTKLHAECAGCKVVRKIQCSACWVNDVLDLLEDSIVDTVEVVHAKWIDAREYCGDYMCSNCDSLYGTNKFNYCPNCGAKMDGERIDNERKTD